MSLDSFKSSICEFYEASLLFFKCGFLPFKEFKHACKKVSLAKHRGFLNEEDFYILYGLYKQAKFGDFKDDYKRQSDDEITDKRNSWKKLKGMSRKEAITSYIKYSNKFLQDFNEKSQMNSNSAVFSRVMMIDNQEDFEYDEFFTLISESKFDKVRELVEKNPNLVNVKSPEGLSPLHLASDRGWLDIVNYLLDKGSNINARDDNGDTPLHMAIESQKEDVVKRLIKRGADLELK